MKKRSREEMQQAREQAVKDYVNGMKYREILIKHHISTSKLEEWLFYAGVERRGSNHNPKNRKKRESEQLSKLTPRQVYKGLDELYKHKKPTNEIIRAVGTLYKLGWTVEEIFQDEHVKLTRSAVRKIIKNKQWEKTESNYIYQ